MGRSLPNQTFCPKTLVEIVNFVCWLWYPMVWSDARSRFFEAIFRWDYYFMKSVFCIKHISFHNVDGALSNQKALKESGDWGPRANEVASTFVLSLKTTLAFLGLQPASLPCIFRLASSYKCLSQLLKITSSLFLEDTCYSLDTICPRVSRAGGTVLGVPALRRWTLQRWGWGHQPWNGFTVFFRSLVSSCQTRS